jgi:hypothetical protein
MIINSNFTNLLLGISKYVHNKQAVLERVREQKDESEAEMIQVVESRE